jgi:hypothetical protein
MFVPASLAQVYFHNNTVSEEQEYVYKFFSAHVKSPIDGNLGEKSAGLCNNAT